VSLHLKEHGNGWNVTKNCEQVRPQYKYLLLYDIICLDTNRQLQKLLDSGIEERIYIFWLFWARDLTNAYGIVIMGTLCWR